ncbi:uncharacterized protein LOC131840762 isoform X1 [Achroia grisella]|uniref:uncharacterized protein LOC131840762 isoform X1 n=1 Tax=Achroia grisella TaxID=688607 RepID=UPI0027D3446E|nr:uncharacterized protein LOC131840762 isoform X1 [Achroia grisella]
MNKLKRKNRLPEQNSAMSDKTKDIIQKVCYRRTASVDMLKYGFTIECKTRPVNLLIKPLREQLVKICEVIDPEELIDEMRLWLWDYNVYNGLGDSSHAKPSISVPRRQSPSKRSQKDLYTQVRAQGTPTKNNVDSISNRITRKNFLKKTR